MTSEDPTWLTPHERHDLAEAFRAGRYADLVEAVARVKRDAFLAGAETVRFNHRESVDTYIADRLAATAPATTEEVAEELRDAVPGALGIANARAIAARLVADAHSRVLRRSA